MDANNLLKQNAIKVNEIKVDQQQDQVVQQDQQQNQIMQQDQQRSQVVQQDQQQNRNDLIQNMEQALRQEQEQEQENKSRPPVEVAGEYARMIKADKKFFFFFFRMKQVKKNVDRYLALCERSITKDTDFEAFKAGAVDTLLELIRVCEEYTGARKEGRDDPDTRSGMVNALRKNALQSLKQIGGMSKERFDKAFVQGRSNEVRFNALLRTDFELDGMEDEDSEELYDEAVDNAFKRKHKSLDKYVDLFSGDKELQNDLKKYLLIIKKDLPAKEEDCEERLNFLKELCVKIGGKLVGIAKEGATLESSKIRRENANKLKKIFVWENSKLSGITVRDVIDRRYSNLDWIFGDRTDQYRMEDVPKEISEAIIYTDQEVKEPERFKKIKAENKRDANEYNGIFGTNAMDNAINTEKMAMVLNAKHVVAPVKFVSITDVDDDGNEEVLNGYYTKGKGCTYAEALDAARKNKVNLIYSDKALKDLSSIQLMDVICGQVNRTEDSLRLTVKTGSIEGENYLIIESVTAENNEYSFGTAKFKDINKTGKLSSTRTIWDEKRQRLNLFDYDHKLADRIIDMDVEKLEEYFGDLEEERLEALKDRFANLQECLKKDRDDKTSVRNQYESKMAKFKNKSKAQEEVEKSYHKVVLDHYRKTDGANTYVNPGLLMDYGDTEEKSKKVVDGKNVNAFKDGWDVSDANEYSDDELNSVKLRKQKLQDIADRSNEDINQAAENGYKYSKEFMTIIIGLDHYTKLDASGEKALIMGRTKREDILKLVKGYEIDPKFLQAYDKLCNSEFFAHLESYLVSDVKKKMVAQKTAIEAIKEDSRTAAQKRELESINKYLGFLKDTEGTLDISKIQKADVDEAKYQICEDIGAKTVATNMRDEKDSVLFPHEPCIQDVLQGHCGDCYFLGSVAAIVDKNPEYIKSIMKDDGQGNVYVRFFAKKAGKRQPIYIKVKKSIPVDDNGREKYALKSLWVQMLEKAFVVSGLHGLTLSETNAKDPELTKGKFMELGKAGLRSYRHIRSGKEDDVYRMLLDENASLVDTNQDETYIRSHNVEGTDLVKDRRVRNEEGFLEFAGNLRTAADDLRSELMHAQERNQIITISSRENLVQSSDKNPLGSELVERGFATTHVYTFLGIEKKGSTYYARLRNPWGVGVIKSVRNPLTGQVSYVRSEDTTGSFRVDMKTLVTYMSRVFYTNAPTVK